MARTRVHQLAKELGLDSKEVIEEAKKHGIKVKNHMSSLSDADEMMLRAFLEPRRVAAPPAPTPEPAPAPESPAPAAERPVERPAPPPEPPSRPAPAPREVVVAAPPGSRTAAAAGQDVATEDEAPAEAAPRAAPEAPAAEEVRSEPREVEALPPAEVAARARRSGTPSEEAAPETAAAEEPEQKEAGPPAVKAVPTATAVPPQPGDGTLVTPEQRQVRRPPRRQAEILGRKDIPQRRAPVGRRAGSSAPSSGSGGSGLIATRSEGGRRTFVVTGRGRGGPGRGGPGRGGPGGRDRGGRGRSRERTMTRPRSTRDVTVKVPDELRVELPITLKGLSEKLGVKANILIQKLFLNHKKVLKINDPLDKETVELLGLEFDCDITCVEKEDIETKVLEELEAAHKEESDTLALRPPIVTFLGHVDHGKTSLLDAIRTTNIASKEHGGITQHIGSSRVVLPDGRAVVFLDTPGHRAFTEMRARGAQVTDVVVLVVAADDGVMPQTKEAIAHARAANVPIVVALNKMDKPDANPMKVRQELAAEGLQDEQWGGETIIQEVSALKGTGIQELLEVLLLESEMLELKSNPDRPALATVVEAEQTRGEGNVARLLVNDGTLKKGDTFVCGTAYGRIRAIKGPDGESVTEAGPATPVEITGLNELPTAGDKLYVLQDLNQAREIASKRTQLKREREIAAATSHVSLETLFDKVKGDTLKLILKVDVTGSQEVLTREIMDIQHPEIRPDIIHAGVGGITETDVALADASDAVILGFHVTADLGSRRLADEKKVEIRTYQVIYKLIEELKDALAGRLAPEEKEVITGEAEVRQTWQVSRIGTIAGCYMQQGTIRRDSHVRVSRGGIVILEEGRLGSLKRFKDDVREVKEGFECGLTIDGFDKIEVGDTITAFDKEQVKRTFEG